MRNTVAIGILLIVVLIFLTGCTTAVPVSAKFPDAPSQSSLEMCPDLNKLQDGAKLSDVSKTVAINYETYYHCAVKSDTWIEWYKIQKQIFENAGK